MCAVVKLTRDGPDEAQQIAGDGLLLGLAESEQVEEAAAEAILRGPRTPRDHPHTMLSPTFAQLDAHNACSPVWSTFQVFSLAFLSQCQKALFRRLVEQSPIHGYRCHNGLNTAHARQP